jgi:UDP-hydrolysing UDP-N-acetyl-D-glucosamine 2-epimerase
VSNAARKRLKVAIVTGSRAEFGLLTPVMRAVKAHSRLKLQVIAAGSHFLPPARTIREVEAAFPVAARVRMQQSAGSRRTRLDDAAATGRGIAGFARAFASLRPDWVVVLGDRIEALAAASAASIAGIAVAHIHGGDRAEGIADEAMRHAITKLAHLHLAATEQSADRIRKMGEDPGHVHAVGSPAIDGIRSIKPMTDAEARTRGDPRTIVLLHPSGLPEPEERRCARIVAGAVAASCSSPVLILAPNHDPGRKALIDSLSHDHLARKGRTGWRYEDHLPRARFLSLLKRLATQRARGLLIGNSSAGLIEAAALGLPVVNIGPRQDGRERADNFLDVPISGTRFGDRISDAIAVSFHREISTRHPYGDGRTGPRIARLLAATDPHDPALLRKRNAY